MRRATASTAFRTRFPRLSAALLAAAVTAPPAFALDPGEDGVRITIPISGTDDLAYAGALDNAGNLVMAGATSSGLGALASVTRDGFLNSAFGGGGNGFATYDFSSSTDAFYALVPNGDGRFVGCGVTFGTTTGIDFLVARFESDGSLDPSFAGGHVGTPFSLTGSGGQLFDQCDAVAVQSDGKIVAAGFTDENGPDQVGLIRLTTDGQLDTTFGNQGKVVINAGQSANGSSQARALVIQPDGKLLIAGFASGQFNSELLVMRLDSDGSPDATFGTGGIVRTPVGTGEDIANAIVLQPDGRIVAAGSSVAADGRRDFALARYTTTGALDATFGTGGLVTTPVGPGDDIAYALTLMPWGRLVAAGSARISTSAGGTDLALISYNADGSVDRFFGNQGIVMLNVSDNQDTVYGLVKDIDGEHFWAVGTAEPTTNQDFLAVEFGLDDTIFRHGFDTDTAP
ncbi:MAG TPA: hypothetical protein VH375_05355 [Rhodanobacteraceae bacterium]